MGNTNRSRSDCRASTPPERKQPFGDRARQTLAELTLQKEAELRCTKTDRYKQQVCSVCVTHASVPTGPWTLAAGLAMIT
nr:MULTISPECIES: thermonuclease family protein [Comamonas]